MAITVDAITNIPDATTTSLVGAHTCSGSGRILFVAAVNFSGSGISSITYNGISLTPLSGLPINIPGTSAFLYFSYLINPPTGSHNITVNAGSPNILYAVGASYTGVKQSSPVEASNTTTVNTSTSISQSVTATDKDWSIAAVCSSNGLFALTGGSGTTLRVGSNAQNFRVFDSNGNVGPGSTSLVVNLSSNLAAAMAIACFRGEYFLGGMV